MSLSFVDPVFLREGGASAFGKQIQRLMGLIGFGDVVDIDGPGDRGGDVIGRLQGIDWVVQCKWHKRASKSTDEDAVNEVHNAMQYYGADRGVAVTNTAFTRQAKDRAAALRRFGVTIDLWDGQTLQLLYRRVPARIKPFTLHPYQEKAVIKAWTALLDDEQALVYLATGLGKTVVAGRLVTQLIERKPHAKILVVAHTGDLVEQLERAMWRDIPKNVPTRVVSGEFKPDDLSGITFAVLPTATSYVRSGFVPDAVIVDEAHHVGESGDYAEILSRLDKVPRLGVTATPWRGDQYDIENIFGPAVVKVSISEGMRLGYLAAVHYRLFDDNVDWDFVRANSAHGYSIKDLNKRLFIPERDEAIRDRLLQVWQNTPSPRGIVFCQTIPHAEKMAEYLRGVPGWEKTRAIHGQMGKMERRDALLRFRNGEIPILTSVDLLNEGVDVPDVNILAFARVTHSRRIFVQQLGRGLRLREGKEAVEVLDFVSDIRRLAELYDLREQIREDEVEQVSVPRNQIEFTDSNVESLLQQWIKDVGDLAGSDDSVRLRLPTDYDADFPAADGGY